MMTHLRGHYWFPGGGAHDLSLCGKADLPHYCVTPNVMQVGCPTCLELIEHLITIKLAVLIGLKNGKLYAVPTFRGHPYCDHPDMKPFYVSQQEGATSSST